MFKRINTLIINSLLVVLLLGILIMPISSLGLAGIKTQDGRNEVLSVQDTKEAVEEENKFQGEEEKYYEEWIAQQEETQESTDSAQTQEDTRVEE